MDDGRGALARERLEQARRAQTRSSSPCGDDDDRAGAARSTRTREVGVGSLAIAGERSRGRGSRACRSGSVGHERPSGTMPGRRSCTTPRSADARRTAPSTPPSASGSSSSTCPLVRGLARRYAEPRRAAGRPRAGGHHRPDQGDRPLRPERGFKLASFATPTILGEIRRHFRDRSWTVRVPRGIQEARAQITQAVSELSAENGRSPTVNEIAEWTGLPVDDVLDALAAGSAQRPGPARLARLGGRGGRRHRGGPRRPRLRAGRGPGDALARASPTCPRASA